MRSTLMSLVAVVVVGCGGGSRPEAKEPVPSPSAAAASPMPAIEPALVSALAHVPGDAAVVVGVDVVRLADTRYGATLRASMVGRELPPACDALTVADFGSLIFAVRGQDDLVMIPTGPMPEALVRSCASAIVTAKGGKLVSSTVAGRRAYHVEGSPEDNGWVSWLPPGQMVMATSEGGLRAAIDPALPRLTSALGALVQSAERSRMVWVAARVAPSWVAELGLPLPTLVAPVSVRAALDLGDEIDVAVALSLGPATDEARVADAEAVADALRDLVAQVRTSSVRGLVAGVQIVVEGAEVRIYAHLDRAAVDSLGRFVRVK